MSKRLRDPDYAAVCRARLHRDDGRSAPADQSAFDPLAFDVPLEPVKRKTLFPNFVRYTVLIGSLSAVLMLFAAVVLDPPDLAWDDLWATAAKVPSGFAVIALRDEPAVPKTPLPDADVDHVQEAAAELEPADAPLARFTSLDLLDPVSDQGAPTMTVEVPGVPAPEVTLRMSHAAASERVHDAPEAAIGVPSGSGLKLSPAAYDFLVKKGDEMLARGDVAGARLVYGRAAEAGDARAADGMARTFDAKVLKAMRVFGIRPEPDKAAFWYARAKALGTVASAP